MYVPLDHFSAIALQNSIQVFGITGNLFSSPQNAKNCLDSDFQVSIKGTNLKV